MKSDTNKRKVQLLTDNYIGSTDMPSRPNLNQVNLRSFFKATSKGNRYWYLMKYGIYKQKRASLYIKIELGSN